MIFMTGGTFTTEAQAFLNDIANVRLEKPFEARSLRALIRGRIAGVEPA
jgi:hypothetical protein